MILRRPKETERYSWTNHVQQKMIYYGISPSLIQRIIRYPQRIEEGIALNTIAAMQPSTSKKHHEIWVMYQLAKQRVNSKHQIPNSKKKQIKIITAWRYPGKTTAKNPIPREILQEIKNIL